MNKPWKYTWTYLCVFPFSPCSVLKSSHWNMNKIKEFQIKEMCLEWITSREKKAFAKAVSTVTATVFLEVHIDFNFLFWARSFHAQNILNCHLNSKFERLMFVTSIPLLAPIETLILYSSSMILICLHIRSQTDQILTYIRGKKSKINPATA